MNRTGIDTAGISSVVWEPTTLNSDLPRARLRNVRIVVSISLYSIEETIKGSCIGCDANGVPVEK
jgi:hypothetical protein